MTKQKKISVAAYIRLQIAASGIPQTEIAAALGYDKPNVITMIKQGKTKLPLNKIGPLADVLCIDPVHLLRLTMEEYIPDTWAEIQIIVGKSLVTEREMAIINVVRQTCGVNELSLEKMEDRMALGKAIDKIAAPQFKTAFSFS